MFKRTINVEVVKTPKEPLSPKREIDPLFINSMILVNAEKAAIGFVAVYAAVKTIDTVSKIAIIKAVR